MDTTSRNVIIALVIIAGIAFLVWALWDPEEDTVTGATTTPTTTVTTSTTSNQGGGASTSTTATSSVAVALLDTAGETTGKERGCDRVVMVRYEIPATTMPLTAALERLFSLPEPNVDMWYNFIAKTSSTLHFDHATVENGTAKIYLTGDLSGLAGVCDDPRASAQIEETALQFPTVERVELYLNGTQTSLVPDARGL